MAGLLPLEENIVKDLGEIWSAFLRLPVQHSDDIRDFRDGVHVLQRIIMSRPVQRELNEK